MITIKIKNSQQLLKNERNWIVSKIAPYIVDVDHEVEKVIANEIRQSFEAKNINADVEVIKSE